MNLTGKGLPENSLRGAGAAFEVATPWAASRLATPTESQATKRQKSRRLRRLLFAASDRRGNMNASLGLVRPHQLPRIPKAAPPFIAGRSGSGTWRPPLPSLGSAPDAAGPGERELGVTLYQRRTLSQTALSPRAAHAQKRPAPGLEKEVAAIDCLGIRL